MKTILEIPKRLTLQRIGECWPVIYSTEAMVFILNFLVWMRKIKTAKLIELVGENPQWINQFKFPSSIILTNEIKLLNLSIGYVYAVPAPWPRSIITQRFIYRYRAKGLLKTVLFCFTSQTVFQSYTEQCAKIPCKPIKIFVQKLFFISQNESWPKAHSLIKIKVIK